jgi:hypothetical protein
LAKKLERLEMNTKRGGSVKSKNRGADEKKLLTEVASSVYCSCSTNTTRGKQTERDYCCVSLVQVYRLHVRG